MERHGQEIRSTTILRVIREAQDAAVVRAAIMDLGYEKRRRRLPRPRREARRPQSGHPARRRASRSAASASPKPSRSSSSPRSSARRRPTSAGRPWPRSASSATTGSSTTSSRPSTTPNGSSGPRPSPSSWARSSEIIDRRDVKPDPGPDPHDGPRKRGDRRPGHRRIPGARRGQPAAPPRSPEQLLGHDPGERRPGPGQASSPACPSPYLLDLLKDGEWQVRAGGRRGPRAGSATSRASSPWS